MADVAVQNPPVKPGKKVLLFSIFPELQLVLNPGDEEWVTDAGGRSRRIVRQEHRMVIFQHHLAEIPEEDLQHVKDTNVQYGSEIISIPEMAAMRKDRARRATFLGMMKKVSVNEHDPKHRLQYPILDWDDFWEKALDRQKALDNPEKAK